MYVNIHTHRLTVDATDAIEIVNVPFGQNWQGHVFSTGVHPWDAEACNWDSVAYQLDLYGHSDAFVAVGEIGLDRACNVDWDAQVQVFSVQLSWAQCHSYPVILHCVRSYYDIIAVVKKLKVTVPLIFHGYSGNARVTEALLGYGCYFSLGMQGLCDMHRRNVPFDRFFLETDCDNDNSIEDVYKKATDVLGISLPELSAALSSNMLSVFGRTI